jgi:hypothetical protein
LRGGVELLQLYEHRLSLCSLGADPVGARARCRGPEQARQKQADQQCREHNLLPRHA